MTAFFKNIFESIFPSDWIPFDPNKQSPYNTTTYRGRIAHFYTIMSPRTLFITKSQLTKSLNILNKYKKSPSVLFKTNGAIDEAMNKKLWTAKLHKESIIHPDSKEPIFWAFRFSAFPLLNIPITTLLLYPGSIGLTVFAQFINQTYNVAVNYANRNASNPMSNTKLFASYTAAVATSCGIGFGLRQITKKHNLAHHVFLRGFIPYTAITLASCLNLYAIRYNELTEGIKIYIKSAGQWEEVGSSRIAGHVALAKCSAARMIWSIPPLFFPPLIMRILFTKRAWFRQLKSWKKLCIESCVIGGVLLSFIPPSLAIFPQRDSVTNRWLEPRYQQQFPVHTKFYFNKGL